MVAKQPRGGRAKNLSASSSSEPGSGSLGASLLPWLPGCFPCLASWLLTLREAEPAARSFGDYLWLMTGVGLAGRGCRAPAPCCSQGSSTRACVFASPAHVSFPQPLPTNKPFWSNQTWRRGKKNPLQRLFFWWLSREAPAKESVAAAPRRAGRSSAAPGARRICITLSPAAKQLLLCS